MYGNLLGWFASAGIAIFTIVIIIAGGVPGQITPPTKMLPAALNPATFPTDPNAILPQGTGDCNAGDVYREAAAAVKRDARLFSAFAAANRDGKHPEQKRAAGVALESDIALLVKARDCGKMNLFAKNPAEVVNYDNAKPVLPELQQLAQVAVAMGGSYASRDPKDMQKAKQYMEAAFVMGRNLFNERVSFEEYRIGTEAMSNAGMMLANPNFGPYAKDKPVADQLTKLAGEIDNYQKTQLPRVWRALSGIETDQEGTLLYVGDMYDIALNSKEPMWRTEALLKLGRMQYMQEVKRAPDQKGAIRTLKHVADDPTAPPNVKAAATAGRDLTVEKFRMYGGGA